MGLIYAVSISCLDLYHGNTQWQGKVSIVLLSEFKTVRKNPAQGLLGEIKSKTAHRFALLRVLPHFAKRNDTGRLNEALITRNDLET